MSLLERHLEQISLSAESIATLPFPPPKIFTNALLAAPDITSLIRDTEPHERALFSVPPPAAPLTSSTPYPDPSTTRRGRRQTVFNVAHGEVTAGTAAGSRAPRRNTAVAAVLGPALHSQVRRAEGAGDVDVEVLLRGAETLNAVYGVAGAPQRIDALRTRHVHTRDALAHYEEKVRRQMRELERMNRGGTPGGEDRGREEEEEEEGEGEGWGGEAQDLEDGVTEEDLRAEEEEIRELERKKRELEERISGMERDLGGLLR